MTNLAGKPPLGLKDRDKPKEPKRRKPVRKRSRKREAYLASPEREAGEAHMARVAQLPCIVCGAWPVEVHHPWPRNDGEVMPLCPPHHRREFGPGAFHYAPSQFYETHGTREALLKRVAEMLLWKDQDVF